MLAFYQVCSILFDLAFFGNLCECQFFHALCLMISYNLQALNVEALDFCKVPQVAWLTQMLHANDAMWRCL